jgi:hypothetical protein
MHCGEDDSSPYITSYRNGPYSSSIASSASSSSASVWSDASSQSSDDSSTTADSEILDTYCCTSQPQPSFITSSTTYEQTSSNATSWPNQQATAEVPQPPELRQHPRRTSAGATSRTGCPPALVRQCDRKVNFVDSLVGKKTMIP